MSTDLPVSLPPVRACGAAALFLACALSAAPAHAQQLDWRLSGFGTAGWARTDQSYDFQRFLSESGSLKRDSVLGGQLDLQIAPTWSATVQLTVAPP